MEHDMQEVDRTYTAAEKRLRETSSHLENAESTLKKTSSLVDDAVTAYKRSLKGLRDSQSFLEGEIHASSLAMKSMTEDFQKLAEVRDVKQRAQATLSRGREHFQTEILHTQEVEETLRNVTEATTSSEVVVQRVDNVLPKLQDLSIECQKVVKEVKSTTAEALRISNMIHYVRGEKGDATEEKSGLQEKREALQAALEREEKIQGAQTEILRGLLKRLIARIRHARSTSVAAKPNVETGINAISPELGEALERHAIETLARLDEGLQTLKPSSCDALQAEVQKLDFILASACSDVLASTRRLAQK